METVPSIPPPVSPTSIDCPEAITKGAAASALLISPAPPVLPIPAEGGVSELLPGVTARFAAVAVSPAATVTAVGELIPPSMEVWKLVVTTVDDGRYRLPGCTTLPGVIGSA